MTITTELSRMPPYAGDGVTTEFAYTFRVLDDNELLVIERAADGTETVKSITSDYTVSGVGNAGGGNVTMLAAPAAGIELHIILDPDFTQLVDLVADDIEKIADLNTQQNKRTRDIVNRSLRLGETEDEQAGSFDAGGRRISGVGDGQELDDVATYGQVELIAGSTSQAVQAASAAASAQVAAEAARDAAQAAQALTDSLYDLFDDRFLGAKSSDPTADNDGQSLQEGMLYYNDVTDKIRYYTSSGWKEMDIEAAINAASTAQTAAGTATAAAATATAKAAEADTSQQIAQASEMSAGTAASQAQASESKAQQWAENPHNAEVQTGEYSAHHWAIEAQNAAGGGVTSFNSRVGAVTSESGDYASDQITHNTGTVADELATAVKSVDGKTPDTNGAVTLGALTYGPNASDPYDAGGRRISNIAAPTSANDAARKSELDTKQDSPTSGNVTKYGLNALRTNNHWRAGIGIGGWALEYLDGNTCTAVGNGCGRYAQGNQWAMFGDWCALYGGAGTYNASFGNWSAPNLCGSYNANFGAFSLNVIYGDYNTAVGFGAFSWFSGDGNLQTVTNVDITNNRLTVTGHGLAAGERRPAKFTTSSTAPSGLSNNSIYTLKGIDADIVEVVGKDITSAGSGTHQIVLSKRIDNSIAIGRHAQPTKSNEAVIGNGAVTDIRLGNGAKIITDKMNEVPFARLKFAVDLGTYAITIEHSDNIASITRNGVGDYLVQFMTPASNSDYLVIANGWWNILVNPTNTYTNSFVLRCFNSAGGVSDTEKVSLVVYGGK